jgi:multidrug efflux pump subunit AcrA (membrane-fusion protein)
MRGRLVFAPVLAAAAVIGIGAWRLNSGDAASASTSVPLVRVALGDVTVTVGGVGRVVQARASTPIVVPSTTSASASGPATSGSAAPSEARADSVFPRATGHLLQFFVVPGQRVVANQRLALIDDGGVAAAAVTQAGDDLAIAQLDLRQKRTSDPAKGLPPTAAELTAAHAAETAARTRLARLLLPPRPADVSAARLDVKKAEADLRALRIGTLGTPAARAEAIRLARRNIGVAGAKLEKILTPSPTDVSAATAEVSKAQSDLATLLRPVQPPLPEAVKAAQQTVAAIRDKLAKLTGPPDPATLATAQADLAKATSDLAVLQRSLPTPLPEALTAAAVAFEVAQQSLNDAKALDPPDPAAVRTAEADVAKTRADLAALQQPPPGPLPEEIATAQAAMESARLKLAKLQGPADAADVSATNGELDKAIADLAALKRPPLPPLPKAVAAARQALEAARVKRTALLHPPQADVAAARLDLARARSELRVLKIGPTRAALTAARQAVATAKVKLAQLFAPPLQADVATARADVRKAVADLTVLRTRGAPASAIDIELASRKVSAAESRLAVALAAERLLIVRAPVAGMVTALLTVRGAPVDGSTPIATVSDLAHLGVAVDLSEFDVARVKRGQHAVVAVDALGGKPYPGKVLFAAPTGVDNGGVVTFPVRVGLARTAGLKPGMNASVRIIVAQRRHVLQLPLEAVSHNDDDLPIVSVLGPAGEPITRKVTLGLASNKNVEIVKGLHAGERVVFGETQGGD